MVRSLIEIHLNKAELSMKLFNIIAPKPIHHSLRRAVLSLIGAAGLGLCASASFAQTQGSATQVDIIKTAKVISMRDLYARSLFQYIRSNPAVWDDPSFYVNFLIYIMSHDPQFNCDAAFSSEFERRDYFVKSFELKDQIRSVVAGVDIRSRFDVMYTIDTGEYAFSTGALPLTNVRSVQSSHPISGTINEQSGVQYCAQRALQGTSVNANEFPWRFNVVDESGQRHSGNSFPFGATLTLPENDARTLFNTFGRQLYAIVSYNVRAANNGERMIQVFPTDGQLFGLSSEAVVRVETYTHPSQSAADYLKLTAPLSIETLGVKQALTAQFQQQGFRAVGKGELNSPGSDITGPSVTNITGSAAVGNSTFVLQISTPTKESKAIDGTVKKVADTVVTYYGSVDYEKAAGGVLPISGQALVQKNKLGQAQPEERWENFSGTLTKVEATAQQASE
ncbi:hypothetical protein [Roseovarius sp. EL26]|uniref:hypothetical protein n=1 Tax=Roseovarius sp. EL26 TaxID=2126672 RepID=UPI0013C427F3|nr:hypothetical protein [Roseovarius sp. EL26]